LIKLSKLILLKSLKDHNQSSEKLKNKKVVYAVASAFAKLRMKMIALRRKTLHGK